MLDPKYVHIGCSPISWMSDDEPELAGDITWRQTASEIALGGYEGLELGSAYPADSKLLKRELDLRGLKLCNAWFSMRFSQRPMQETVQRFKAHLDFMEAMGAPVIGAGECGVTIHLSKEIPLYPAPPVLSDQQFGALAEGLNECGRLAKERGIQFGIHPHMGTGVQSEEDVGRVMNATDPELVKLILDTGHTAAAGGDPCALLEKYIGRIPLVHIKDGRRAVMKRVKEENLSFLEGVKAGIFTTPGDGDAVDWDRFFSILDRHDFRGWIVVEAEQDPTKAHPLAYTMNARKFIREKIGFARWLINAPRILFLDEPTKGIDVYSKSEIYKLINQLAADGTAIIMISSEMPELLGMSDRVLVMAQGRVNGILDIAEATQEKLLTLAMGESISGVEE